MKVEYLYSESVLYFNFVYESSDRTEYQTYERKRVHRAQTRCKFMLPPGGELPSNDRVVLTALLCIYSFVGKRFVVPFETSQGFKEAVREHLGLQVIDEPSAMNIELERRLVRPRSAGRRVTWVPGEDEVEEDNTVAEDDPADFEFIENPLEASADEGGVLGVAREAPLEVTEEPQQEVTEEPQPEVTEEAPKEVTEEPREVVERAPGRPGLCLSMGVDSCAGLALMPEETACIFLDRIFPPNVRETIYNKDHVYSALYAVREMGREVYLVRSDMEYLREHRGFVLDIGVGAPAVLMSERLGLNSVGYGYSIHNFTNYRTGVTCTGDYCTFRHRPWNEVFKSTGLFLNFITAGLTEIGTQMVVLKSPFSSLASGCMRGGLGGPCQKCPKCYRKLLLEDVLRGGRLARGGGNWGELQKSSEHKMERIFGEFSSGLVMAYAFALSRGGDGGDPFLRAVQTRLASENPFNWKQEIGRIDKWFRGADSKVDPQCLPVLKERLAFYGIGEL